MVLTLSDVLARVEEASIDVLLGEETVQQALALAQQEKAGLLPQLFLNASQRRAQTASVGGSPANSGVNNRFDGTLNAQINVLDPVRIARYQAAKVGVDVARLAETDVRQAVLALATELFFGHLRNLARLDVVDADIERARSLLDLAQRQLDAGVATQIDVTRAESLLATAEQARLQQETEVIATELQLKRLLTLDPERPLRLRSYYMTERLPDDPVLSGQLAFLEQTAFEQRADLLLATRLLDRSELEVRAARFNRLPALAITGSYGYATEVVFDGDESDVWSVGAALSVPIFDGNETRALTRLARSRLRAAELQQADIERQISIELRLALQDLRSRNAQVGVARRTVALANDELRLAQIRFENGVADNREMVEAQNRLANAADNLVEALFRLNLSRLALARATGDVRDILNGRNDAPDEQD